VDFGELNDKAIKGPIDLSKIVSMFYLYIHKHLLKHLFMDEYYMTHIEQDNYLDDPNAQVTNIKH
jgi:hypothetical protein